MPTKKTSDRALTALFVEGTSILGPQGRDDLSQLWRELYARSSAHPGEVIVHGFTKQQLVIMSRADAEKIKMAGKVRFDTLLRLKYDEKPFDRLVIAFDALPENQEVIDVGRESCLASERDFVLRCLAESDETPARFRGAAKALVEHYRANRGKPRKRARPPFGDLEIVYMDPCFESLVLADLAAVRDVFGYSSVPKDWSPKLSKASKPDIAFSQIVETHRKDGPPYLRVSYKARKHAWAHEVIRKAHSSSKVWQHEIADRLRAVFV